MARHELVSYTLTCDVCGDEVPQSDTDGASRKIGWEGAEYLVDLCATHQKELTDTTDNLRVFIDAGQRRPGGGRRRAGGQQPSSRSARARPANATLSAVRAWARDNGYEVGDRGRIPAVVMAAYQEVHG